MSGVVPFTFANPLAPGYWKSNASTHWVTPDDRMHIIPWAFAVVPTGHKWRLDKVVVTNWSAAPAHWSATIELPGYNNAVRDLLDAPNPPPFGPPTQNVDGVRVYTSTLAWGALIAPGDPEILEPGIWMDSGYVFAAASDPGTFGAIRGAVMLTISGLDLS